MSAELGEVELSAVAAQMAGAGVDLAGPLTARLIAGGYRLLDAQFITDHLTQFAAEEVPRADYHRRLALALGEPADFGDQPPLAGAEALQVISQAS